jgi:peroxiredoxin
MPDRPGREGVSVLEVGSPAPDYRAPTNKGHTLDAGVFRSRLPVVLFFVGGLGEPADLATLWAFDALLPEFGSRRVQLLGVVRETARGLRDQCGETAVTVLADEDGSIRAAYGGWEHPFSVVVDRHGDIVAVVQSDDGPSHPQAVLALVDALRDERPDTMTGTPGDDADERRGSSTGGGTADDDTDDNEREYVGDPVSPRPGPDLPND